MNLNLKSIFYQLFVLVHILVFTRQNNSFRVWGSHVFLRPGVIPARTHPPYKQYVRPYLERNIVTYEASTNIDNPPQRAPTPTAIGRLLNVAPANKPVTTPANAEP